MNHYLLTTLAQSRDVALIISLAWNIALGVAFWRLWRSRERLQEKVTAMLAEILREVIPLTTRLAERREER